MVSAETTIKIKLNSKHR